MSLMSKDQAYELMKKALSFSKADETEVNLYNSAAGNIRYARNSVSTSGKVNNATLVVQCAFGKKVGTTTLNEFDDASIRKAVQRAEELAKLAPENEEYMPIMEQQQYAESPTFSQATADVSADYRTEVARTSIELAQAKGLVAAGFFNDTASMAAMMNSKGLAAYRKETEARFNLTVRTADGSGSGYCARSVTDIARFSSKEASEFAVEKARLSAGAVAIEPGKYTVILEPAAGVVLLEQMFFNMDQRTADEGRSFMSKKGGGTKVGEKMVDERVNMYSDPFDAALPTSTWAQDGQVLRKESWIEKGVVKQVPVSRYWAREKNLKPIPSPSTVIMQGGTASTEDLVRNTEKGILVTRLWYIREVDPQTVLLTGLTRDGTFLIENGKIKNPIKNFRFNESPVIMLNNLVELGKQERVLSGESDNSYLIPTMKIRDFTFSSLSDAV
jgi:predicted Zn-dependent protease